MALSNVESQEKQFRSDYGQSIPEIYGDKNLFIQALINISLKMLSHASTNYAKNLALAFRQKSHIRQPINGTVHSTLAEIIVKDNGPNKSRN